MRNGGQKYESVIQNLLRVRGLYPKIIKHNNDAGFVHKGVDYYVEVKNNKAHDFGQKKLIWTKINGWQWNAKDPITDLYDVFKVRERIRSFVPKKFTEKNDASFKKEYKEFDQKQFESGAIDISNTSLISRYYAAKDCHYIQIEDRGFYYLDFDIAGLDPNMPKFKPKIMIRLRAKTHRSLPNYNYSFFAVLVAYPSVMLPSRYDIERKEQRAFPPIKKS